ncbi:MAG: MraY family glycosyltransferase [bacterium]
MDVRLPSLLLTSLGTAFLVTPIARGLGASLGLLDHPCQRKVQRTAIPRTGGIGILAGLSSGMALLATLAGSLGIPLGREVLAVCLGGLVVHAVGVLDDLWDIPAPAKLLAQSAAVGAVVSSGVVLQGLSLGGHDWSLGFFAAPLTALFILGFINALNLVDGLDGLASGIAAVAAFAMVATGVLEGNAMLAGLAMLLLGATLGFMPYNFLRGKKVFLGDGGSMLLGYGIAVVAVEGSRFGGGDATPLLVVLACASVPILDTATTIARRVRNHQGLFRADSMHVHHRFLRFGLTPVRTVGTILGITLVIACQSLAGLVEGLRGLLAVSVLAAVLVAAGIRRAPHERTSPESDPSFREILFYLLGAQDGATPRLRGDMALTEILSGTPRARSAPAATPEPAGAPARAAEPASVEAAAAVPE